MSPSRGCFTILDRDCRAAGPASEREMASAHFDDEDFATVDTGASMSEPKQCSALRTNGFVVIKNRPCQITSMSVSKTGKHGAAKVHLVGVDIFTGKKFEEQNSSTSTMMVPSITRKEYQLLDIRDDFLSLMADDLTVRENIKVPEGDVGNELREKWESKNDDDMIYVSVVSAMGEEHALRFRVCQP
ncbi:Eukaryotic translation initiation factor 5A [Fasciola gigantica]|uniref:Eukaryotic translation initiation factor 5A n=1 Tax=Fasciola gigantica TaxID=46835 RepID=A0A504YWG8_FASGI|nr:Eukaryotic translation initiation factor 5A [Fasciola gigantica]